MKLSASLPLGFSIALLATTAALAAPSVSGVSGAASGGKTIRITGSGFGTKSPAAPYLWADFENGINPSNLGQKSSWDVVTNMTWAPGEGYKGGGAAKASDSSGNWTLGTVFNSWTAERQRSYVYRRTRQNFLVTDVSQNWKTWRVWADGGKPNIYTAANIDRVFVEYVGTEDSAFWGKVNPQSTNWITEEIRMQASSAINVKDGQLLYRVDGQDMSSGNILTRSSLAPAYMVLNFAVHFVLANVQLWTPAWNSNNRVWADSVYVDTSWAHVMIGDASTYAACRALDIQIPTDWADGAVSVVSFTPSFANGSKAFVYVIDKDGNVNANGYGITIGQGNTPTNAAPSVSVGSDQTVTLGTNAQLTATVTDDGLPTPPGALTYTWTKVSGPSGATFGSASAKNTSISFTTAGTYVFRLTASDGALSDDDDVQVTVNAPAPANKAPNANAGGDATVTLGTSAQLSGSATDDGLPTPPGALTYAWSKVSGPSGAQLANAGAARTAVSFAAAGTYVFRLTVTDGDLSDSDDVQITVQAPAPTNQAPTADAGGDQTVVLGSNAQLSGTGSDDGLPASPGALSYAWSKVSGPSGAQIGSAGSRNTSVSFAAAGTYVFRLTVSDGLLTDTDDVQVTVQAGTPTNAAPTADAGADASVVLGSAGQLNGNGTDDGLPSTPGALSYAWTRVSGPSGAQIANAAAARTSVSFTSAGTYVFRLTVSDGTLTDADEVQLTVQAPVPVNAAPTVNAGNDVSVTLGTNAQLSGSASDDGLPKPPGALTYAWTRISGPSGAQILSPSARTTAVSFTRAGTYVFRLTANDGELSDDDDVQVIVNSPPVRANAPPRINAGDDQTVLLGTRATLSATVTDDGLPAGVLAISWSRVSGPGPVTFSAPDGAVTTASFQTAGTYTLEVDVNDGQLSDGDDLTVTVLPQVTSDVAGGGAASGASGAETPRNVFNPVRGETARLPLVLKGPGSVKAVIYDRGGRPVKEIVDDSADGGTHLVHWDGRNEDGSLVASGLYFVLLTGSDGSRSRQKVAVIK